MKKIIIGFLVIVALVFVTLTLSKGDATPTDESAQSTGSGGNVTQQVDIYTNGVGTGNAHAVFSRSGTIALGANQGAWCNSGVRSVGKTAYVNFAGITTSGTASSTMKVFIATSTTATIASDYVAPFGSLINNFQLATSSLATTTSSIDYKRAGFGTIPVPVGQCAVVQIQAASVSCPTTGGSCESATSTNRGFSLDWILQGYYKF